MPTSFIVVRLNDSWVSFTADYGVIDSDIAPEDEDALRPILEALGE